MAIRNSAKAIVINHGQILLNRCTSRFGEYYALPGGGQNPGETLQEAVQRELLEETGYRVKPLRLSGIYESVADRTGTEDGCLCHKIYFIFVCRLMDPHPARPTEHDKFQIGLDWVDLQKIRTGNLFPHAIRDNLTALLNAEDAIYIGSEKERI